MWAACCFSSKATPAFPDGRRVLDDQLHVIPYNDVARQRYGTVNAQELQAVGPSMVPAVDRIRPESYAVLRSRTG